MEFKLHKAHFTVYSKRSVSLQEATLLLFDESGAQNLFTNGCVLLYAILHNYLELHGKIAEEDLQLDKVRYLFVVKGWIRR